MLPLNLGKIVIDYFKYIFIGITNILKNTSCIRPNLIIKIMYVR